MASLAEVLVIPNPKTKIHINLNPFRCDCDLLWLITKVKCVKHCSNGGCDRSSCKSAFLYSYFEFTDLNCASPQQFRNLPLFEVPVHRLGCATRGTAVRNATTPQTHPNGIQQTVHAPAQGTVQQSHITVTLQVAQGNTNVVAARNRSHDNRASEGDGTDSANLQAANTTEIEGSTVITATVKRDKPAVGTVHIIIMASASLLGLVFAACLILKLVKYRRAQNLRNLEKRTTRVLHHPYTVPFHNPAYTFPGTGPVPAMELLQVVPPIQNVFYNRDSVATLANQPHFNPPLPPIENSFYRPSNTPASKPNKAQMRALPPIENSFYRPSNDSAPKPNKTPVPPIENAFYRPSNNPSPKPNRAQMRALPPIENSFYRPSNKPALPPNRKKVKTPVPPIENSFYRPSNKPASPPNRKKVKTPVPPIENSFYRPSNNPASPPNKTHVKTPLPVPPIQNVSYQSNTPVGVRKKRKSKMSAA
ncbi:hypothetical protein Bbelb_002680 [Branchiostoma belcheri]|nr:hypothetical protein Bbelb_002680 [Branchiostoma belcheri]